jgi:hypothetical protein
MKCEIKTEDLDKARNLGVNKRPIIQVPLEPNQEDSAMYFALNNELIEPGSSGVNYVFKNSNVVAASKRVSKESERKLKLGNKDTLKFDKSINTEIGTQTHEILAKYLQSYVEAYYADTKSTASFTKEYEGKLGFKAEHILSLEKQAKDIFEQLHNIQKEIDPKKKMLVTVENIVWSPIDDIAGTVDIFAQFSDGTAALLDHKTYGAKGTLIDKKGEPIKRGIEGLKEKGYRYSMLAYTDILRKNLGIKEFRQVRLIPIMVTNDGKKLTSLKTVNDVAEESKKFLDQIPILTEYTGNKNLDNALKKLIDLKNSIDVRRLSLQGQEKERAFNKVKELEDAIKDMMLKKDLKNLFESLQITFNELKDIENLTTIELADYYAELTALQSIIELQGKEMVKAVPEEDKLKLEQMLGVVDIRIKNYLSNLNDRIQDEVEKLFDRLRIDDVEQLKQLTFINQWDRASESDIPHIKALGYLRSIAYNKQQQATAEFVKGITEIDDEVRNWAKGKGMKVQEAYDSILTDKTNLIGQLSKEFYQEAEKGNEEWLKSNFTLKPEAEEKYNKIKKRQIDFLNKKYEAIKQENPKKAKEWLEEELEKWQDKNNINAVLKTKYRGMYWQITPEALQKYKSDAYKKIEGTPLQKLHTFLVDFNKQAEEIIGEDVPLNFVPWLRRSLTENLNVTDEKARKSLLKSIKAWGTIREGDNSFGEIDPVTGEPVKKIPIYFTNPFRDGDGKIDYEEKSRDLVTSYILFAKETVFNYKYISEIEPYAHLLRNSLNNYKVENPTVKNKLGKMAEKIYKEAGVDTTLFAQFDSILNQGIYNMTTDAQGKITIGPLTLSAGLVKDLMQFNAKRALGFKFIAGAASYLAPKVFIQNFGIKGKIFTTKQNFEAHKLIRKRDKQAGEFVDYFNTFSEDMTLRRALTRSTSRKYLNDHIWFEVFSFPDRMIDIEIALSMAQNYGFDETGTIRRLENIPGAKSILELFKEGHKFTEEEYFQFRQAFKEAGKKIKGTMPPDELSAYRSNIILTAATQFKTWMPGVLSERFGGLKFNKALDMTDLGTHTALLMEYAKMENESMQKYLLNYALPKVLQTMVDVVTFGQVFKGSRVNEERARNYYDKWRLENPEQAKNVSFEDFLEVKKVQIAGALREIRMILGAIGLIMMMGFKGDDDEPYYKTNWYTRNSYRLLNKAYGELSFSYNPAEVFRVLNQPVAILGILNDVRRFIGNTVDETRDRLIEENNKKDKTDIGHYGLQFVPGYNGAGQLIELSDEQESFTGETK